MENQLQNRRVADDEPASEMFLELNGFDEHSYEKVFPKDITFGYRVVLSWTGKGIV